MRVYVCMCVCIHERVCDEKFNGSSGLQIKQEPLLGLRARI